MQDHQNISITNRKRTMQNKQNISITKDSCTRGPLSPHIFVVFASWGSSVYKQIPRTMGIKEDWRWNQCERLDILLNCFNKPNWYKYCTNKSPVSRVYLYVCAQILINFMKWLNNAPAMWPCHPCQPLPSAPYTFYSPCQRVQRAHRQDKS